MTGKIFGLLGVGVLLYAGALNPNIMLVGAGLLLLALGALFIDRHEAKTTDVDTPVVNPVPVPVRNQKGKGTFRR
ncbi:MAG TPA: hypothetical protein PKA63_14670 [Oligoflexia bacterium]|nr:hypothetical protein [Oligoflexia bacterium]HMP49909.1 hypothetical protein [Oligoflexia bacterium]